jgi:lysozyme
VNIGNYRGVPEQIMRWNKANGKVLEGLTRRRQAEADLFNAD